MSSAAASGCRATTCCIPIGCDAFGLPTENYAIKNHVHPRIVTKTEHRTAFKSQLTVAGLLASTGTVRSIPPTRHITSGRSGFSCSCSRRVLRTRPRCRSTGAPAASACWPTRKSWTACASAAAARSSAREKSQWMLAHHRVRRQRLIDDLDDVDYHRPRQDPAAQLDRPLRRARRSTFSTTAGEPLTVYTTRPDTLFGATYMVISPEHPLIDKWKDKLTNMRRRARLPRGGRARKSDFERTELAKDKTGVQARRRIARSTPSTARRSPSSSPTMF